MLNIRTCSVALVSVVALGATFCKPPPKKGEAIETEVTVAEGGVEDKVKMEFYVMSQCPYGTQVQLGVAPALRKMKNYVDFSMDYIATQTPDGEFKCLHKEPECKGNIAQLCLMKHAPDKWIDAVTCMAEDMRGIPDNYAECAEKAGIDVAAVKACYEGQEGKDLLAASSKKAKERGARGSPTIFINDKPYRGGRTEQAFTTAVCLELPEEDRPDFCPEVKEVDLTIVSDERCKECAARARGLKNQFDSMFMKLNVHEVDWSSPEAEEIKEKTDIRLLPAYVFHANVKDDPGWNMIQKHVDAKGGYFVIKPERVRSQFDPTKEICDNEKDDTDNGLVDCKDPDCEGHVACMENCTNGVDDTDNGLVDCKDPDCEAKLVCREEEPKSVDLFVMSHCPFGMKAQNAFPEVLENFGRDMDFDMHFITSVLDDDEYESFPRKNWCEKYDDDLWYCSMHGKAETDENLRQICVQKLGKRAQLMDYVICRNEDPRNPDWQKCATEAGLDVEKIETCATGPQGRKLLQADSELSDALNFHASPTYLINNKHQEKTSPNAEAIKTIFCKHNEGLAGCENKLSGPKEQPKGKPAPSCG
jgi:glutaredoxin